MRSGEWRSLSWIALWLLTVVLAGWQVTPASGAGAVDDIPVVRLLSPPPGYHEGALRVAALVIEPDPWRVVFYLDGAEVERRKVPPWGARVALDSPPREQIVRVEVLSRNDDVLGSDELVLNRRRRPLRARLESVEADAAGVTVRSRISVPEEVELESVVVTLNDSQADLRSPGEIRDGVVESRFERTEAAATDIVRVVAKLADGRALEDARLVEAAGYSERLEVPLVQLQVTVTDRRGAPVTGLELESFSIRDGRRFRSPDSFYEADEVSLLLGLALDSSGSMRPIWPATRSAAASFLDLSLIERDQGFLVDFDDRLRLVRERTGDKPWLESGLEEIEPAGGTALYDSILFSLLQFERQPGRRGLVVLTDGVELHSSTDPKRVIELGKRLGVPIYLLVLEPRLGRVAAEPDRDPYPGTPSSLPPAQVPPQPGKIPVSVPGQPSGPYTGPSPSPPGQNPGSYPGGSQPRTMPGAGGWTPGQPSGSSPPRGSARPPRAPAPEVHSLRLLAEPTGGRLYRISSVEILRRAFAQINAELRSQYVLTYYAEEAPPAGKPPEVRVEAPGGKKLDVRVTVSSDQIY